MVLKFLLRSHMSHPFTFHWRKPDTWANLTSMERKEKFSERGHNRKRDVIIFNIINSIQIQISSFNWPLSELCVNLWMDRIDLMWNTFSTGRIKVSHLFCHVWQRLLFSPTWLLLIPFKKPSGWLLWLHSLVSYYIFLGKVALFFPVSLFCPSFYPFPPII